MSGTVKSLPSWQAYFEGHWSTFEYKPQDAIAHHLRNDELRVSLCVAGEAGTTQAWEFRG